MHVLRAFEVGIRPEAPDNPASVKIALLRYIRGEDGRLLITPECASFEAMEGKIKSLQDGLDEIRDRARRQFQVIWFDASDPLCRVVSRHVQHM